MYLAEAHATDEWPISQLGALDRPRHRGVADRLAAARALAASPYALGGFEGVLDAPDDAFNRLFASWPVRFWVVRGGVVAFKAMPRDATYDVGDLEAWLDANL